MSTDPNAAGPDPGTREGSAADQAAGQARRGKRGPLQNLNEWLRTPPSETLAGSGTIALTAIFVILLTIALLYRMTVLWPVCDDVKNDGAAPSPTPAVAAGAANANAADANPADVTAGATPGGNLQAGATPAGVNRNANAAAAPSPSPAASPRGADINAIEPTSGSVLGKTLVIIKGRNLGSREGLVVKFGEAKATVGKVTDDSILVRTPPHSEGLVDVSVERNGQVEDVLPAEYTYVCPAPAGTDLFLMLVMAGALGGCIHALRSLWWYTGQGTLKLKWMLMYFCLPFIGAAMAMLFSLLIVAGFVGNSTGRGESLFIIAVAGLVGMFSQQAALKLTDIANAFFTKPGEGKDSNPQRSLPVSATENAAATLAATAMDKSSGPAAGDTEVTITGAGFSQETVVSFGRTPAKAVRQVTPRSITVVTPAHVVGEVEVEVTSGSSTVKLPETFRYT